jgi:histidinol-phosphate phosphatase family protein
MGYLEIDKTWTLFLDRDGVINEKRENDYVKNWNEFSFLNGALDAISKLSNIFGRIIVVTNQRGVGRGFMKEKDLIAIHEKMINEIILNSGRIDKIYCCTDILDESNCRKPNIGMGIQAMRDFPEINPQKSIMIGDSISDMIFGNNLGFYCIMIHCNDSYKPSKTNWDLNFQSLFDFYNSVKNEE